MYYVYILRSKKDNKLYIGSTINLERRLSEHNNGEVIATKYRTPLRLLSFISVEKRTTAQELEKYFKTGSGYAFVRNRLLK